MSIRPHGALQNKSETKVRYLADCDDRSGPHREFIWARIIRVCAPPPIVHRPGRSYFIHATSSHRTGLQGHPFYSVPRECDLAPRASAHERTPAAGGDHPAHGTLRYRSDRSDRRKDQFRIDRWIHRRTNRTASAKTGGHHSGQASRLTKHDYGQREQQPQKGSEEAEEGETQGAARAPRYLNLLRDDLRWRCVVRGRDDIPPGGSLTFRNTACLCKPVQNAVTHSR